MKDLVTLWKHTRMVVLVALTAAVYAAILIPFKIAIPLIPGFTEVRPANVIPVICSLLFGPAAAWGAAFGNLAGDIYGGTLSPGSAFGFVGNFLYGYVPYKLWAQRWRRSAEPEPDMKSVRQVVEYAAGAILASAACALIIAWGVNALGLVPFAVLGPIILVNNAAVAIILGPPLLRILYPRVRRWGLLYRDVMPVDDLSRGRFALIGVFLLMVGAIGGLMQGTYTAATFPEASLTLITAPLVAAMLIAAALL
jgi:energy-coupling factor transport system substrate-specific component